MNYRSSWTVRAAYVNHIHIHACMCGGMIPMGEDYPGEWEELTSSIDGPWFSVPGPLW